MPQLAVRGSLIAAVALVAIGLTAVRRRSRDGRLQRPRPLSRPRRLPGLPRPARLARPPRPLAAQPGRLEPGHLAGRRSPAARRRSSPTSTPTAATTCTPTSARPRPYGFPYAVVGRGQPQLPINYTAYGCESDRGPFPIPQRAPVEGGRRSDGDRHVLVVDRARCKLYELYRAFFVRRGRDHWNADSRRRLEPALGRAATRRLDLGRRRRAADLPRPGPLRRGRRRAASTTRSGSPSSAPATPGSTPPRTAPATPRAPTRRRWGCGCG